MKLIQLTCIIAQVLQVYSHPYHVVVSASFGSRSHASSMLELAEILSKQGHKITFASTTEKLVFSHGYNVTNYDLGSYPDYDHDLQVVNDGFILSPVKVDPKPAISQFFAKSLSGFYRVSFPSLDAFATEHKPDLFLCDLAAPACHDVAYKHRIPLIIVTQLIEFTGLIKETFLTESNSHLPATTDKINYWEKFQDKVMNTIKEIGNSAPAINQLNLERVRAGVEIISDDLFPLDSALVLADSFMGFLPAASISPVAELVGPIVSKSSSTLDDEMSSFMVNKKSVMYASFGSEIRMASFDFENILASVLDSFESNTLDGFIFSLGKTKFEYLPDTINYKDQTYSMEEILKKYKNKILLKTWTQQYAILNHPSTTVFLSHSGMGSIHESIAAFKPILSYPITADQPRNAYRIRDLGIGLRVDRYDTSPTHLATAIHTLVTDPNGSFRANLARLRAISCLDSPASLNRRKQVAADLVMTHIRTAQACRPILGPSCELSHRLTARRHLSFLQAYNIDVWLPIIVVSLFSSIVFSYYMIRLLNFVITFVYAGYSTAPLHPSTKKQL